MKKAHEDTLATQTKTISMCQGDIEALKRTNHDKQQEGSQLIQDIDITVQHIEKKEGEQFQTKRELEVTRDKNEQLKREIEIV